MHYFRRPSWRLPESAVTPEAAFDARPRGGAMASALSRRRALALGLAAGATATIAPLGRGIAQEAEGAGEAETTAPTGPRAPGTPWTPTPVTNPAFADAGRPITDETLNSTYNNFYEFGSHKRIWERAQRLETDVWPIQIDGLVEEPFEIDAWDLIDRMPMEERIYRLRCVEAWAMVAPWIGFPMTELLALARPLGSARYLRFETFNNPSVAPGQRQPWLPWPYVEGMTIEEAANELSFMVVGAYGKAMVQQHGAPIRIHQPWKYGFKAIKSIVRISFVEERPVSFWEELQSSEYGFWANVNPEVSHPRWSQATERLLGFEDRVPTQIFNGYGEQVAHLYTGMEEEVGDRLWR